MLKELIARVKQGHRTIAFPGKEPFLSDRYRGRPVIVRDKCAEACRNCAETCPTEAIKISAGKNPNIDLGLCIFCTACARACEPQAITYTADFQMAGRTREDLITENGTLKPLNMLDEKCRRLFGRSLKLRQVSAAGCNACEQDVNVLNTVVFDLGRFGIQFVASPRHADGLLITGPVSKNMELAMKKTYEAVPSPKIVIAAGACAISGGLYADSLKTHNGADSILPVDLYIPGCPPHPLTILDGLLRLLGRLENKKSCEVGLIRKAGLDR